MTTIPPTPESVAIGQLDSVRREFRRSRRESTPERWDTRRLSEQLPRLALHDALQVLLAWRGDSRFDTGAATWHARLAGHTPGLTLDDSKRALTALEELGGSRPEVGALALRALCDRYWLTDAAAVLDDWLASRQSYGGL
jgi:hypothetical protein